MRRKYRELARSEPELHAADLARRERATTALTTALLPGATEIGMTERDLRLLCSAYSAVTETVAALQPASTTAQAWADDRAHAVSLLRAGWENAE